MKLKSFVFTTALLSLSTLAQAEAKADARTLEQGRYILSIAGCNDCHTPHYPESGGKIPPKDWLTGSSVGFQGPWGTTYPANLRLSAQAMSEADWIKRARSELRPPMPWFSLRDMRDTDLRAMYQYIRSLGPAGQPAPAYVPPGKETSTPYFEFMPKLPASKKTATR